MEDSVAEGTAPGLSPLILACLAATWLIWGSTYLAIKWALISLPPFFQMGTRFLVAGARPLAWVGRLPQAGWPPRAQRRPPPSGRELGAGGRRGPRPPSGASRACQPVAA